MFKNVVRPHVLINVAATADGKIDSVERRGATISSRRDKERVDKLRADSDAVMIGANTLHDEDPKLTVKSEALRAARVQHAMSPNPAKVAVSSHLHLQPNAAFLNAGPARIILFTTSQTEEAQLQMLHQHGAEVHCLGEEQVDLVAMMRLLKENGINRLLVEGGAALNFELLRLNLVDELTVFIAPMIFGGETAPTLAAGSGFLHSQAVPLKLVESKSWEDGGVLLHYQLLKGK